MKTRMLVLKKIKTTIVFLSVLVMIACSNNTNLKDKILVEKNSPIIHNRITVEYLGIETIGKQFTPIIESGTSVPCQKSNIFSTAEDNQNQITIALFRGKNNTIRDAHHLGKYQIINIAPAPRGIPKIKVTFVITKKDIFIAAYDTINKKSMKIVYVE